MVRLFSNVNTMAANAVSTGFPFSKKHMKDITLNQKQYDAIFNTLKSSLTYENYESLEDDIELADDVYAHTEGHVHYVTKPIINVHNEVSGGYDTEFLEELDTAFVYCFDITIHDYSGGRPKKTAVKREQVYKMTEQLEKTIC